MLERFYQYGLIINNSGMISYAPTEHEKDVQLRLGDGIVALKTKETSLPLTFTLLNLVEGTYYYLYSIEGSAESAILEDWLECLGLGKFVPLLGNPDYIITNHTLTVEPLPKEFKINFCPTKTTFETHLESAKALAKALHLKCVPHTSIKNALKRYATINSHADITDEQITAIIQELPPESPLHSIAYSSELRKSKNLLANYLTTLYTEYQKLGLSIDNIKGATYLPIPRKERTYLLKELPYTDPLTPSAANSFFTYFNSRFVKIATIYPYILDKTSFSLLHINSLLANYRQPDGTNFFKDWYFSLATPNYLDAQLFDYANVPFSKTYNLLSPKKTPAPDSALPNDMWEIFRDKVIINNRSLAKAAVALESRVNTNFWILIDSKENPMGFVNYAKEISSHVQVQYLRQLPEKPINNIINVYVLYPSAYANKSDEELMQYFQFNEQFYLESLDGKMKLPMFSYTCVIKYPYDVVKSIGVDYTNTIKDMATPWRMAVTQRCLMYIRNGVYCWE